MLFILVFLITRLSAHFLPYEGSHGVSVEIQHSQCAHQALEDVIEKCASGGIEVLSPSLRKMSAVKLSVCEFQDALIDYPDSCKNLNLDADYHQCVQDLRSTAQYWTTYSGNYRIIKSICHEEAMPFFKEHILALFNNVTRMYTSFYEASQESTKSAEEFQKAVKRQFYDLIEEFSGLVEKARSERTDVEREAMTFREDMNLIYHDIQKSAEGGLENIRQSLSTVNDEVKEQSLSIRAIKEEEMNRFKEINSIWDSFKHNLEVELFGVGSSLDAIQTELSDYIETRSKLRESLEIDRTLMAEFQYQVRSMAFKIQDHFESQRTFFENTLAIILTQVEVLFNSSLAQVDASQAKMVENALTVNNLIKEASASLSEMVTETSSAIYKAITDSRKAALFNPFKMFLSLASASPTITIILLAVLAACQLVPYTPLNKTYEFLKFFFIGVLVACVACAYFGP